MRARAWKLSRAGIPLAFLAIFFAWPLGKIFGRALRPSALGSARTRNDGHDHG